MTIELNPFQKQWYTIYKYMGCILLCRLDSRPLNTFYFFRDPITAKLRAHSYLNLNEALFANLAQLLHSLDYCHIFKYCAKSREMPLITQRVGMQCTYVAGQF